jgi:hypothetical protein
MKTKEQIDKAIKFIRENKESGPDYYKLGYLDEDVKELYCDVDPFSSRTCEKGTRSCVVEHEPTIMDTWIEELEVKNKRLYSNDPYIRWTKGDEKICLDGNFTTRQLDALSQHMKKHEN